MFLVNIQIICDLKIRGPSDPLLLTCNLCTFWIYSFNSLHLGLSRSNYDKTFNYVPCAFSDVTIKNNISKPHNLYDDIKELTNDVLFQGGLLFICVLNYLTNSESYITILVGYIST